MKLFLILLSFVITTSDGWKISKLKSNSIPKKEDVQYFKSWQPYIVSIKNNTPLYDFSGEKWDKKVNLNFDIEMDRENLSYFMYPTTKLKVENGWLVGFNHGEWSGALYWYSEDGKEKYLIVKRNVHNILQLNKRFYITQGLSHLGRDYGFISEIIFDKNKWLVAKTQKLSGCPFQSIIFKDSLLILTTKNIVIADEGLDLTTKIDNGFWASLYPNSIITKKNIAYFGMRGGILKVNLKNGTKDWLTE